MKWANIVFRIKRKIYRSTIKRYQALKFKLSIGKLMSDTSLIQSNINVRDLIIHHNDSSSNFSRMDTVVRYLAIEEYYGINDYGYSLYNKMQRIRLGDNGSLSLRRFIQLIKNIELLGYSKNSLITVNQMGFLQDGSHRLAYAIYSGRPRLPLSFVEGLNSLDYSIGWFKKNDFSIEEVSQIEKGYSRIKEKLEISFPIVLWGAVAEYFEEITEVIGERFKILQTLDVDFKSELSYFNTIRSIYSIDSISEWKVEKKIDFLKEYKNTARLITIEIQNPEFRSKGNGRVISKTMEGLKKEIRSVYKKKVPNYFYDIIIHAGDNYNHSKYVVDLLSADLDLSGYFDAIKAFSYFMIKRDVPYQCSDFPKSFCLGKDVDLIVTSDDYMALCNTTLLFFDRVKELYTIKIEKSDSGFKIRLELESRLVLQVDICSSINGLSSAFLDSCISSAVEVNGVKSLDDSYEYFIRKNEIMLNPHKLHHELFIDKIESDSQMIGELNVILQAHKELDKLIKDNARQR